jgi:hypothetical protein
MRCLKYCHLRYTIFVPPQRIPGGFGFESQGARAFDCVIGYIDRSSALSLADPDRRWLEIPAYDASASIWLWADEPTPRGILSCLRLISLLQFVLRA